MWGACPAPKVGAQPGLRGARVAAVGLRLWRALAVRRPKGAQTRSLPKGKGNGGGEARDTNGLLLPAGRAGRGLDRLFSPQAHAGPDRLGGRLARGRR